MAYNSNNLKNKLRQESSLPEGFSFDEMKEGIYSKMPPQNKKKRRILFFWWLFPVFLISAGVYLLIENSIESKHLDSQNEQISSKNDSVAYGLSSEEKSDKNNYHDSKIVENRDINSQNQKTLAQSKPNFETKKYASQSTNNFPFSKRSHDSNNMEAPSSSNSSSYFYKENNNSKTKTSNPLESQKSPNTEDVNSNNLNGNVGDGLAKSDLFTSQLNDTQAQRLLAIEAIPSIQMHSIPRRNLLKSPLISNEIIPFKNVNKMLLSIEMGSGLLVWNTQNELNIEIQNSDHHAKIKQSSSYSYQAFLHGNLVWNNGFYLTSGIDYQKRYSVFEYEGTLKFTEILDNQIIRIEQNLLSGTNSEIYGSANVTTTTERKIRKNNFDHFVNLPVLAGYNFQIKNWGFQAGAGVSLNLFSRHIGYTLANGAIVSYDGTHPLWNAQMDFNFESQAKIKYYLGPNVYLGANTRYSKALSNQILSDAVVIRPYQFSFSALIGYTF